MKAALSLPRPAVRSRTSFPPLSDDQIGMELGHEWMAGLFKPVSGEQPMLAGLPRVLPGEASF